MALNINNAATTEYSTIEDVLDNYKLNPVNLDSVEDMEETVYQNERFAQDWTAFNQIPKLKSAILMKAIWTCGKGYQSDARTKVILDHVVGNGKQTFQDILFNMIVMKQVARDSFCEIIRDKETGTIINLKVLDPSRMRIIFDRKGQIIRYEQTKNIPSKGSIWGKIKSGFSSLMGKSSTEFVKYAPEEIFHLSNNCLGGQTHGISVPESVEKIILADDENFNVMRKLTRFQAVPFIIFKLKTDDAVKIAEFKSKLKTARTDGEDFCIPDDENLLSFEVVQVNPSSLLMEWRNSINNQFYQAVGMPLILFGSAGSTESGGKIEYLGHETVFEHDQIEIEEQIWAQLGLRINLNSPTSLLENLQADESKDAQNALTFQPSDVNASRGR